MTKAAPKAGFPPAVPGFEALRAQQEAFFKAMMAGFPSAPKDDDKP